MSIEIMTEVWKHATVDQGTLLVLLALADSADERSRSCYPGIDGLAAKSRLSERQVQYCLQRLREIGIVEVKRNASPVKTNLYRITEVARWEQARDAIIAPHATKPETQSVACRDATHCVTDTQPIAPKPSVTSVIEPSDVRETDLFSAKYVSEKKTDEVDDTSRTFTRRDSTGLDRSSTGVEESTYAAGRAPADREVARSRRSGRLR